MEDNLLDPRRSQVRKLRFGTFEVDLQERELYNRGIRVGLQHKPFRILELLLRKRGVLVTREELAQHLWPNLHVSFDRGLNTAVNVLRRTLGDSPTNCRYIETRSGLGYRFIAQVEQVAISQLAEPPETTIDSVAVLPFEAPDSDPALALVADGVTDGLIARLSGLSHVKVIARTTSFHFKGTNHDPSAAATRLNVRTVLTGRVARDRELLRISTELIEASSGRRLWGDDYRTLPVGVFAVEKKICGEVSERLAAPADSAPPAVAPNSTASVEARQDYLKGRYFYGKLSEEELRKSVAHFESALKLDPHYALAYTGLANAYSLFALLGLLSASGARTRVAQFAAAALELDPKLAEAHAALAGLKKLFDWDWTGAEREYLTALELNPNCADARHSYAVLLCATGRAEEARSEIRRAQELDPLSMVIGAEAAWISYMSRDYQGAIEQSWKTLVLETRYAPAQHALGLACEQLAMHEEAITELENARVCSGNHPAAIAALAHAHASSGNRDEALRNLYSLEQLSHHRHVSPYWLSVVHTGLGSLDRALDCIENAVEARDVWSVWLNVEPRLDPLRSGARFDRILRRLAIHSTEPASNL
jgi:TolB-like protein/tetratricopeptide (TPR) repeat protein